jgi:sodium transport system ATP-binding protein
MISVSNLTKEFSLNRLQRKQSGGVTSVKAVDNVSFECKPGRIFSLIGPNGAGKTTALRIISTILKPTSGFVTVAGHDVVNQAREVKRSLGFLTGSTGLYARLTPNEVVKYFADLNGVDKTTFERRRDELFTLLGMHDFSKKRIGKLSTGMRQKVSICRTIIHDPDVVVFDEPTSGLDVITAANIIELIKRCKAEGKTVIFSTHIMSEVELLCDDLAIIHKGRILQSATYEEFKRSMKADSLVGEFIRIVEEAA